MYLRRIDEIEYKNDNTFLLRVVDIIVLVFTEKVNLITAIFFVVLFVVHYIKEFFLLLMNIILNVVQYFKYVLMMIILNLT